MYASVVQFGSSARTTVKMQQMQIETPNLSHSGGGTLFLPPVLMARDLIQQYGPRDGYTAVVVFMSDGASGDAEQAAQVLGDLAQQYPGQFESHTVGFGSSAPRTLEHMAFSNGQQDKNKCAGNAELATARHATIRPSTIH